MNFVQRNENGSRSIINLDTSEDIRTYVLREYLHPHGYMFPEWDPKLFSKPQHEIIDFLLERFEKTENSLEWLILLPYLRKIVNDKSLFEPFEERKKKKEGILTPTQKESIEQIRAKPIELNINRYDSSEKMKQTVLEV